MTDEIRKKIEEHDTEIIDHLVNNMEPSCACNKSEERILWIFLTFILIGVIIGMRGCDVKPAEAKELTAQEICDAIYWAEGDIKARQPYGIETIECADDCRQICINTVENKRKVDPSLEYLASKYCPYNSEVWLKNVKWFLDNPRGR